MCVCACDHVCVRVCMIEMVLFSLVGTVAVVVAGLMRVCDHVCVRACVRPLVRACVDD